MGSEDNKANEGSGDSGDYLGYDVYADTLWDRVNDALNKDLGEAPLGDDPLVVGIFGEWGAGKSRLLKMVERRAIAQLAKEKNHTAAGDAAVPSLTVPVYFQPWKYEHEEHLLVPMVMHVLEATRLALKSPPEMMAQAKAIAIQADQAARKTGAAVHQAAKTARKWYPILRKIASSLSLFGVSIELPPEIDDWLKDVEDVSASPEAKVKKEAANAQAAQERKIAWDDTGFHYYRLHELLTSLTRNKDEKGQPRVRINFVIFIDDLDRCLPEKAVATLELIKTVFNLESFAFVLALDEEVVERGIGYRYKDYTLAGKKPEMPITGFEYLEKIVHLPFRLPALSRPQAANLLRVHEAKVLAPDQPELWWFAFEDRAGKGHQPESPARGNRGPNLEDGGANSVQQGDARGERNAKMELLPLVLASFDAYVPRKLIRLVELLHQVAAVMRERQRPLTWKPSAEKDPQAVDVRVVLALLMLQLFHPDLYRLMRRRANAFPALLSAFASAHQKEKHALSGAELADIDLYRWVACESALLHASEEGGASGKDTPDPIARIQKIEEPAARALAQQARLPMVELIVQHRAVQRHPFDPLKLLHALASSLDETQSGPEGITGAAYWSLLAPAQEGAQFEAVFAVGEVVRGAILGEMDTDTRVRLSAVSARKVFDELSSSLSSVQANLAQNNGLELGSVLAGEVVADLITLCEAATQAQKQQIQEGLSYLLPYVSRADGVKFAALAAATPDEVFARATPFESPKHIAQAVTHAEAGHALGRDPRFDPQRFHLPRERFGGNTPQVEPIKGFVRVVQTPETGFQLFSGPAVDLKPFCMARYLTTVDQYAHFIADGGYGQLEGEKPAWWDTLGWRWRNGAWDSEVEEEAIRKYLARRSVSLRGAPMHWHEQLVHGSRPVVHLNWFEARAYAKWLNLKLNVELSAELPGYAAQLPTEAEWERAARAEAATKAEGRRYAWGGDGKETAHLSANLEKSGVGRACPVGLFAPNPLGLCDLKGNAWEWQDNLWLQSGEGKDLRQPSDVLDQKTGKSPDNPALRGGSWINSADDARASVRDGLHPGDWDGNVGFRVVLSLA